MYGEGRNRRYFIGFGLVIVLLFLVIFMIVRGGGDEAKVPEAKRTLTSYANESNVTVTQTIIGPITAEETHDEVQINVTNSQTTIDVIKGYDGTVVNSAGYPMTTESFREFLNALEKARFTEGDTGEELKNDKGYCPTGQRYIFEIKQGAQQIQRFWATSCRGPKSYKGELGLTNRLFRAQIPDYGELTRDVNFGSSPLLGL